MKTEQINAALLDSAEYSARLTEQLNAAPDSLQALADRDPAVRAWIAAERGLMLTAQGKARAAIAGARELLSS